MHKNIEELLQKEMSRRQFLRHMLLVFLSVVGVSGFMSRLINPEPYKQNPRAHRGWGNGRFGK